MQTPRVGAVGLLLVVAWLVAIGGCSDNAPEPSIRDTVGRWLDAWTRASGPARDDVAAAAAPRELGGDLLTRVAQAPRDASGQPRPRQLARLYNEIIGLAIPPDRGFEVLSIQRDGASAAVAVRLRYSDGAVGAAASAGLLPFAEIAPLARLLANAPVRLFLLTLIDGAWRITAIRAG